MLCKKHVVVKMKHDDHIDWVSAARLPLGAVGPGAGGQIWGRRSEEWEFLFWESFHRGKQILLSAPCKYFLCCLLSSVIPAPPTPARHSCHSNQSAQHVLCWTPATNVWRGGHRLLDCYLPPLHLQPLPHPSHLPGQQLWGLRSIATGLLCCLQLEPVRQLLLPDGGKRRFRAEDSHFWTGGAHMRFSTLALSLSLSPDSTFDNYSACETFFRLLLFCLGGFVLGQSAAAPQGCKVEAEWVCMCVWAEDITS